MTKKIIAIDGPAGSGKSTMAKLLAEKLGIEYIDSGSIYRALAFYGLTRLGGCQGHEEEIADFFKTDPHALEIRFEQGEQIILLMGRPVGPEIRTPEVTAQVRWVAGHAASRDLVNRQMVKISAFHSVVVDGRDIGTVVFPDTPNKFYLDASPEIRARRRALEMGWDTEGEEFEMLKANIQDRDKSDMERKIAPLIQAEDAIYIDTSLMSIEEVLAAIASHLS